MNRNQPEGATSVGSNPAPRTPEHPGEISQLNMQLNSAIGVAHECLSRLNEKLKPALRNEPQEKIDEPRRPTHTTHGALLNESLEAVFDIQRRIETMTDQLEV